MYLTEENLHKILHEKLEIPENGRIRARVAYNSNSWSLFGGILQYLLYMR